MTLQNEIGGYCLTTAEIHYYLPDQPDILQTFVWQLLDCAPEYPRLRRFVDFWADKNDATIHLVEVADVGTIGPVSAVGAAYSIAIH